MKAPSRAAVGSIVLCALVLLAGAVALHLGLLGDGGPTDNADNPAPDSSTTGDTDRWDSPPAPDGPSGPQGGMPGPDNTGVRDEDRLSPREGGTLRRDGLVVEDAVIAGDVLLAGNDQTLRNVRVEGQVRTIGSGTTIEDSEVGALAISGATNVTVRRVNVSGRMGHDGIHITSDTGRVRDVLIESSWVHSPRVGPESHYDGIQVRGVEGLTIRDSKIDLGTYQRQYTSAVFLQNANGGNVDVLIENNWINGGGYTVNLAGEDVVVRNNVFGPDAEFGLRYPSDAPVSGSGNVWQEGNRPAEL